VLAAGGGKPTFAGADSPTRAAPLSARVGRQPTTTPEPAFARP
jgi:hypothetical protein